MKQSNNCSRSSTTSPREKNSTFRKKRKPDRNIKYRKPYIIPRENQSSIAIEDFEKLGFSTRRRQRPKNEFKKKIMKATIFSWLIDVGIVQEDVKIFSMDEKNKGKIKRDGILCLCCNKILSVANFLVHKGVICDKPYENVYLAYKKDFSLLYYMTKAWNKLEERKWRKMNVIETKDNASDFYDDACMICADGGILMCCEECNSTYHQVCMGVEDVPEGSWYCPYCVCKFCAEPAHENDWLLDCPQCRKRYHWECHQMIEQRNLDLNSIPIAPFCLRSCKEVCDKLARNMVGKRNELDEGYSWTLLHHMEDGSRMFIEDKHLRTMCNSKLAIARRLMEECFEPIQDSANFNRIDFKGFYTAILEKDDEIISVASLRIHGTKLVEMPFIATSEAYRCKGMCRKLMDAIESALCDLNVENLIIPSIPERIESWIERYGFCHLDESMKKEIMVHNTLMFHDSIIISRWIIK
ncbi:Histone acetyltransferase [Handroanthus impetiginosus]|uniref:Histone acetyltransferase n=1 Tax=Handroanthus impetiginosus TaxID=429701 RepID=A0A2G9H7P6_9LAMI|nr:Histone acetyltransferase [Handroanthus impetiginosus]